MSCKKFVVSDLHGSYLTLIQVLKKSKFNYEKDKLIILGDVCDGYPDTKKVIDELLKIKNKIFILGNHDQWFLEWIESNDHTNLNNFAWLFQGGYATLESYGYKLPNKKHIEFLKNHKIYYVDNDNNLYMHGGFNPEIEIACQESSEIIWDRKLWNDLKNGIIKEVKQYNKVFIGHTSTFQYTDYPDQIGNVINIDQGAGRYGKLSMMNVKTGEVFQSINSKDLYAIEKLSEEFSL